MNRSATIFIKNIGAMFFANGTAFLISALSTFLLPKVMRVEDYAYVQLFIFYLSYANYMHYGWVDGIRLRYGGAYYEKLDKNSLSAQLKLYVLLQVIVATIVFFVACVSSTETNRKTVWIALSIYMLFHLPRLMPQYILEMTNRIRECSKIIMLEKITYLSSVVFAILFDTVSIKILLFCELIAQFVTAIYTFYCCRDILVAKSGKISEILPEIRKNIKAGIQLTLANISSVLIIGIIRQFIEKRWDVTTFGKISLTISISNFLMVFIRAIAMVMFPTLRRIDSKQLGSVYTVMRNVIMIPLLGLLVCYYPLRTIMTYWLPHYADGIKYMALLFPMCIFESKMSMLIETYLKTIRKEKWLLLINTFSVIFSTTCAIVTTYVLNNLSMAILSIVLVLAMRCIVAESLLTKHMGMQVTTNIMQEVVLVTIFILSSWFIGEIKGMLIYTLAYAIYLVINKTEVLDTVHYLREKVKR